MYDSNKDYIDIFIPFVLNILLKNYPETLTPKQIVYLLSKEEDYNIEIPIQVINNILRRAKSLGYVTFKNNKSAILQNGIDFFEKIAPREIERNISFFFESLSEYLSQENVIIDLNDTTIDNLFYEFVNNNILSLSCLANDIKDQPVNCFSDYKYFIDFVNMIEKSRPNLYEIFEDILFGSIICYLAKNNGHKGDYKYSGKRIFYDTNIVFGILNYDHEDYSLSSIELHKTLVENGFQIYIFDFTLLEINRVLNNYKNNYKNIINKHLSDIKVNSIYYRLVNKNITPTDIEEIISNIEINLNKNNIKIYPTNADEQELLNNIVDSKIPNISKYKPDAKEASLIHDLLAIEYIKKLNVTPKRKFNDVNNFFLTSDLRLTKYNVEGTHKENGTVSEVILSFLMSTILWIREPGENSKPSLKQIIGLNSKGKLIDRKIWTKFTNTIHSLYDNNKISEREIAILVYNKGVQQDLLEMNEQDEYKITEHSIEEMLDQAKNDLLEKESLLKVKESKLETLEKIIYNEIERQSNKVTKIITIASYLTLTFIGFTISAVGIYQNYNYWAMIALPIIGVFLLCGIKFEVIRLPYLINTKIRPKVHNYYSNLMIKRFELNAIYKMDNTPKNIDEDQKEQ